MLVCTQPNCDFEDTTAKVFNKHLGVFHKFLDHYWNKEVENAKLKAAIPKKKLSLADYKRKQNGDQDVKQEPLEVKTEPQDQNQQQRQQPQHNSPPNNLDMCVVCDKWDSRFEIHQHLIDEHFTSDLVDAKKPDCKICSETKVTRYLALHVAKSVSLNKYILFKKVFILCFFFSMVFCRIS